MAQHRIGIIMHGVTGRMGMNQHLIRSIVEIRKQGGVALANGDSSDARPDSCRTQCRKSRHWLDKYGISRISTGIWMPRSRTRTTPFSSMPPQRKRGLPCSNVRLLRESSVHCEKPVGKSKPDAAMDLYSAAKRVGIKHGVVQDKPGSWLPQNSRC